VGHGHYVTAARDRIRTRILEFTAPAHTALLSAVFLRERLTPSRIGVVIFGFLGVLVILRPGLESFQTAAVLPLAAAFAFAVALTQTKALIVTETPFANTPALIGGSAVRASTTGR
jgi:drug/metabolite transporter (DMT)-like permease